MSGRRRLHQPLLAGARHRLGAIGGVELGEDVRDVRLHRMDADHQGLGDFLVHRARRQQLEHLTLALAQRLSGRSSSSVRMGCAACCAGVEQSIEILACHE